jgi:DNA-binding MarR family transcriptional regulator
MSSEDRFNNSRGYLMRGLLYAYYWMDEGMQNHMRAAGMQPLSRTQSMIMTNVADGITRPSELARNLGISRQAVHQLIADLEKRNLVEMLPDPSDARAKIIRFSSRGWNIGEVALRATKNMETVIEERIGKKALHELRRILLECDWGPVVEPPVRKPVKRARSTS